MKTELVTLNEITLTYSSILYGDFQVRVRARVRTHAHSDVAVQHHLV